MAGSTKLGRSSRIAIVIVAAGLVLAQVALAEQSDGGSGTDAADRADKALRLHSFGRYTGNFTAEESVDWYKIKIKAREEPTCLQVVSTTSAPISAHLVAVTSRSTTHEVEARIDGARAPLVGIASNTFNGAFLHNEADGITLSGDTRYDFDLRAVSLAQAPFEAAGQDAGSTKDTAAGVTAACVAGRLDGAAGDTADVYKLAGNAGDRILVSLAGTASSLTARVSTADGTLATLTGGTEQALTLATTGDYFVTIGDTSTTSTTSSYMLGMCTVNCGPPEDPCQPACVEILANTME